LVGDCYDLRQEGSLGVRIWTTRSNLACFT
jgi:hypothetical protein